MKELQVYKSSPALIDDEDLVRVNSFSNTWHIATDGYVACSKNVGKYKVRTFSLHRFIMKLERNDGNIVDHINHNKLDNRKSNLRLVSKQENALNRSDIKLKAYFDKTRMTWKASIRRNGKLISGKCRKTEQEALSDYPLLLEKYA